MFGGSTPRARKWSSPLTRSELLSELRQCNDVIDRAYWTFTRCARGKPPVLVVPEAYKRRTEILELLRKK